MIQSILTKTDQFQSFAEQSAAEEPQREESCCSPRRTAEGDLQAQIGSDKPPAKPL